MRSYSKLKDYVSFTERLEYLKLDGTVGADTFGVDRYLNQMFYRSAEWKRVRDFVIVRDNGCDLGVSGYEIGEKILIHHMNPITAEDIKSRSLFLLDPEFLICVSHDTHNAIHYGSGSASVVQPTERTRFDTCPWRKIQNDKER